MGNNDNAPSKKNLKPRKLGMSDLARREEKLALRLLLPALIIIALIAFYPLAQVFYTSFTDRVFASGEETNFIGFDNYRRLLSVHITELAPLVDEVI